MASWDETKVGGGGRLLPDGIRNYEITTARVDMVQRGQSISRELIVGLSSPDGSGEATVAVDPFKGKDGTYDTWEWLFKRAASALGFEPMNGAAEMVDIANEFASWVPTSGLVGQMVEVDVEHIPSTKLKDDGTPFINDRATFKRLVGPATGRTHDAPAPPAFAGVGTDASDPWA